MSPHATDVANYKFNHTNYRVKDPKASVDFYTKCLGMTLLGTLEASDAKFTLYFLGYSKEAPPSGDQLKLDLKSNVFGREAVLELTHNWGTENDPNFKGYHTGNSDSQGYGHIAIAVDNLDAATDRLTDLGVTFKKRPNEGKMKGIAFIQDPDGYLIELVSDPHFAN